ncbi:hypothetical protein VZT92_019639 [Zoarces viviparus]|uniref:Secreted protein n=1 Tax=Zoarces viviparus TaxID=48416 RepID=A0AAW1EL61_ZOAVI
MWKLAFVIVLAGKYQSSPGLYEAQPTGTVHGRRDYSAVAANNVSPVRDRLQQPVLLNMRSRPTLKQ